MSLTGANISGHKSGKLLGFLAVTWVCLMGVAPQAYAEGDTVARLQAVLEEFQAANPGAPGIVVHVECPSRNLRWTRAVGQAGPGDHRPLTPDHTFRIASNTKTYVAAAILRLCEMGKMSLSDPLGNHLAPDQRALLAGDGYDLEAMTIGQVLSHTSGLFEHPADPRYEEAILADPHHRWTRSEQVAMCVEWGDPVGEPGEVFSYSDTGYVLLGGIIEEMTGLNLGTAVRMLLDYDKLKLKSTWWETLESPPPGAAPRAHQYYGNDDTFDWDPSLDLYGGGGLISDAADLGRFMRQLIQGRVLETQGDLADMTGQGTTDYRLGLVVTDFGDFLGWGHTGFWNTFAYFVPELDLTVTGSILNHHAEKGRELARRLIEAVNGN